VLRYDEPRVVLTKKNLRVILVLAKKETKKKETKKKETEKKKSKKRNQTKKNGAG
jgi:hypothetical protein